MFQFCFSIDLEHKKWFDATEEVFAIKIKKAGGIYACSADKHRFTVCVACEGGNKAKLLGILKSCFIDMYATVVKYDYLKNNVKLPIERKSYNLLLHTLVAFDRENERELLTEQIRPINGMALDGIFNFKLKELRDRWNEIATLANENGAYLIDEDTLNELIRFLISAVSPKIDELEISQSDNKYNISSKIPNREFEYNVIDTEQLLLYLIDVAPLELRLSGDFTDKHLCDKLVCIFDAKRVNNC